MKKIKAVIFDFDGVIVESVDIKTEAFAEIYKRYGAEVVSKVVQHHLTNGGISRYEKFKYYHRKFLNKEISEKEINNLLVKFSQLVFQKVVGASYIKGAYEFISQYYTIYDFYISSGTPAEEICKIIKERGLEIFFKKIYGSPDTKIQHVQKILSDNRYCSKEVVFIGDANSDRDAAKECNIHFVARIYKESQLAEEPIKITDLDSLQQVIEQLK